MQRSLSPRVGTTPGWTAAQEQRWANVNAQAVEDDVAYLFFYTPHSLALMAATMVSVVLLAMWDSEEQTPLDAFHRSLFGILVVFAAFASVALPNGPFIRPHPIVWRVVLGISVLYWLALITAVFQKRRVVRQWLAFLDGGEVPSLGKEDDPDYAADCSFTFDNLWSRTDVFWIAHGLGWTAKALFLRSTWLCWFVSITWELTEVLVSPVLPNFQECWWDQIVFDVLLCNGGGIYLGMRINRYLEVREYHWELIRNIPTLKGRVQRAAMQLTPATWTPITWDHLTDGKRALCLSGVCCACIVHELCTFFLKASLELPTKHRINVIRLVLWFFFSLPSMKQWYAYMSDPNCKRLGTQVWVALGILFTEVLLCLKFGREIVDGSLALRTFTSWAVGMVACIGVGMLQAEMVRRSLHQASPKRAPSVSRAK